MNKAGGKYTLIIVLVVIALSLVRIIYPLLKNHRNSAQTDQEVTSFISRNIDHLVLSKHAKCRMDCRDITEQEIKEILQKGNINYNKSELDDKRGPSYALEGFSHEQQHLRIIVAPKKKELVVVTCIDLDKEWQCDCN
jgi:hypothetical protein